jgi:Permuted papain-like amidase enzyme, YaeF/YiiX, C92 family
MWSTILTALISRINFYEILFFIFSNIRVPFVKTIKVNPNQMELIRNKLQHGDFIFARREWFLKNVIVPGKYKHVGVYNRLKNCVMEMQNDGYVETPFHLFCRRYTEVAVSRCVKFNPEYLNKFVENMESFSDKDYDSKFSFNTKSMYCSEACYHADSDKLLGYEAQPFFWLNVFIPHTLFSLPAMELKFKIRPRVLTFATKEKDLSEKSEQKKI